MIVIDTCGLLEIFKGKDSSLSKKTQSRLRKEETVILSISFAEIACKVKMGKLKLSLSVKQIYQEIQKETNIRIVPIDVEEWTDSIDLEWSHKDPADRIILSYAQKFKADILTTDKLIKKKYKSIVW